MEKWRLKVKNLKVFTKKRLKEFVIIDQNRNGVRGKWYLGYEPRNTEGVVVDYGRICKDSS